MLQKKRSMKLKRASKFKQSLLFSLASREAKTIKGQLNSGKKGAGGAIKIKNKTKNKPKNEAKGKTKNKGKKTWKQQ
jgi:hypothetical protein